MMPRSCLEIRTRHHVKRRWQSLEDMRAPGVQAGRGDPGPGGRGWGVGGARNPEGGGEKSGDREGLSVGEGRRSGKRRRSCGGTGSECERVTRSAPPRGAGTAAGLAPFSRVDPQNRGEFSTQQPQGTIATWWRGPELRRRALCLLEATLGLPSLAPVEGCPSSWTVAPARFSAGQEAVATEKTNCLPAEVLPAPRRSAQQPGEESSVFASRRCEWGCIYRALTA